MPAAQMTPPPPVTARIVSVERVGVGPVPYAIVIDAFGTEDAKAIVAALAAIGVRPVCELPWSGS